MHSRKLVGPLLILICFLLPWVTPSCSSLALSGWELANLPAEQSQYIIPGPAGMMHWLLVIPVLGIALLTLSAMRKTGANQIRGLLVGVGLLLLGALYFLWNAATASNGSKLDVEGLFVNIISDLIYMPLGPLQLRDAQEVLKFTSKLGLVDATWRNQSEFGFWGTLLGFVLAGSNGVDRADD